MAALGKRNAMVRFGPPLSCSGPKLISAVVRSAKLLPHSLLSAMLWVLPAASAPSQFSAVLAAIRVFFNTA